MNEELKEIFGTFIAVGDKEVPAAHLKYKGESKQYVIWTITGESPSLCGDDTCLYSVVSVDVDIYSDGNYLSIINAVKTLMKENDWIWVEDSPEMYEDDTGLYHKTISFEKERNV